MAEGRLNGGEPRCWSFSPQGQQCEEFAGHTDDHKTTSAWTDDEAWTPAKSAEAALLQRPPAFLPEEGDLLARIGAAVDSPAFTGVVEGMCFNCDHPEHEEPCERLVTSEKLPCGCTFRSV